MTRMKDSGIEWIGEVPEEWGITKLKYICRMQSGNNLTSLEISSENDGGKIFPVYGGNGQRGYYSDFTNEGNYCLVGRQGALAGNVHFVSGKFWATDHAIVVYEHTHTYSKYLCYLLKAMNLNQYAFETSAQPGLSVEKILQLEMIHCPKGEQTQIADFLDKKVAQLDEVKSLLEEQIKTLEDYRRSLIYETVTKGLDKTVPLKDSGVDWIGQIPEGWGITKFKYFLDTNKGLTITKESLIEDGIPVINYGQIHSKYGKSVNTDRDELPQVSANYLKFKQSLLKPGDFVFADTSEDIDGSGNFSTRIDDNGELFAGYHTIKAKLKNALEHDFRYFMHYFDSLAFRKQVQNKVSGIKVYSITQSILQETCLILPSLYEQQQIATFLDKKTEQINQMIAIKKEQIENINKQRQTLIYDYVTGKRRV